MTTDPRPAAAFAAIRAARQPHANADAIAERLRQELAALNLLHAAKGYWPTVAPVDYRWLPAPHPDVEGYNQQRRDRDAERRRREREVAA